MRIALLQISSGPDKMANLELVRTAATDAAARGARLLVFPEATAQAFGTGRLDEQAEDLDGEFATGVRLLAEELGVVIVIGMFTTADTVEREGRELTRVDNTALVTGAGLHQGYRKIHTYEAFGHRESDTVRPGEDLHLFELDGVSVGVAICYDIRFPGQFKELACRGAQLIVVPTSWQDGEEKLDQWQLLARARALDSTTWIAACDQARPEPARKGPTGIGHSMVIGPTGQVVAAAGYGVETLVVDIDFSDLEQIRGMIPVLAED